MLFKSKLNRAIAHGKPTTSARHTKIESLLHAKRSLKSGHLRFEHLSARQMLAADLSSDTASVVDLTSPVSVESNSATVWQDRALEKLAIEAAQNEAQISVDYWLFSWPEGSEPESTYGPSVVKSLESTDLIENAFLVKFQQPFVLQDAQAHLGLNAAPEIAYPLLARQQEKRFIPNDELFFDQWHLRNAAIAPGVPREDINVTPAWDLVTGDGIVIGIVDDGMEYTHPDLAAKYRPDLSFDYFSFDPDPAANIFSDWHGTAVAGVAAADTDNVIGVAGVAPDSELAAIRLVVGATNDAQEAASLIHALEDIDIYNNSWGPPDIGAIDPAAQPGPLALAAIERGITEGRDGLGAVYVWAGGNGFQSQDNVNYDLYANSRHTIAVGAIGFDGVQSFYSEPGAPLLVVAHSNDENIGITTTDIFDLEGYSSTDYTDDFGGTSSAAPAVAGVVALMLEANPNLTHRDVQHVLVNSARRNDIGDSDWFQNGAGHWVNHKYGFGAVDATAAVNLATTWETVGQEFMYETPILDVDLFIPDDDLTGVSVTFPVPDNFSVEYIEVVSETDHIFSGDLVMRVTSPLGTVSEMTELHFDTQDWTLDHGFTSARHWDEPSFGNWTVTVTDELGGFDGTLESIGLRIFGNQRPVTGPSISVSNVSALESDGQLLFDVTLSEPAAVDVTFDAMTAAITAEPGVDFTPLNLVPFVIPAGQISTTVVVEILDDAIEEFDETIYFATVNVTGALTPLTASTGTIVDDDDPTTVVANPWRNLGPRGTLALVSSQNNSVLTSDIDSSTLLFAAQDGAFLVASAIPSVSDATISVELIDPNGATVLGPLTAGPGATVLIPRIDLSENGIYSLRTTADQLTDVEIELLLNAITEDHAGDSSPTPFDLEESALSLVGDRFFARGEFQDSGLALTNGNDPTLFVDISGTGTALDLADDQVTTIATTVGNRVVPAGNLRVSNNGVVVVGDAGIPNHINSNLPVSQFETVLAPFWDDLSDTNGNVYWEETQIGGIDALIIQWDQRRHFNFPNAGDVTFQIQVFATGTLKVRYAYSDVTFADAAPLPAVDNGASATIGLQRTQDELELVGFNEVAVADGDFVDFEIADDTDLFEVDLTDALGLETDFFVAGINGLQLSPAATMRLIGPSGAELAVGTATPGGVAVNNYDLGIGNFQVTVPGVYRIEISDSGLGEYVVVVSESMVFDSESNNDPDGPLRKIATETSAYGHIIQNSDGSSDVDFYAIDLTTNDRLILETFTPFSVGTVGLANELDPVLSIYDPDGNLLLEDTGSAVDGINAFVRFRPPVDGTYKVSIASENRSGNYVIRTSPWLNKAPTNILLSPSTLFENTDTSGGDVGVGTLTAIDSDLLDSAFTFDLVRGPTQNDNALFVISGDQLFIKQGTIIDHELDPNYVVRVQVTDEFGSTFAKDLLITVTNLLEVGNIAVNSGDAQRSRVDSVQVTFDGRALIADGAFIVNQRGTNGGQVDVAFTTALNASNQTVATLTFSGPFTEFGSLADGNYDLLIDGTKVTDLFGGMLDGASSGIGGSNTMFGDEEADAFYRLFGDGDGNRAVNFADFTEFRRTFGLEATDPAYLGHMDFDLSDSINFADFSEFRSRFGLILGFE